jgi:heat shock protein HslJ
MKKNILFALSLVALTMGATGCKTSQKQETLAQDALTGTWTISAAEGNAVSAEEPLTLEFTADGKVHGKVGCNIYNNSYTFDAEQATLTFSDNGQRTMMMCPDMETEDAIVRALTATASVAKGEGECLNLLSATGDIVLTICR